MIVDYFKFSYESIRNRKLRSYLTMVGIFIGIAAVIALISLGQGLQVAIEEQFQAAGSDKIFVAPGSGFGPPALAVSKLTEKDQEIIERVRGVSGVGGITFFFADVRFNDETEFLPVHGFPLDDPDLEVALEAHGTNVISGREFKRGDGKKVMVGFRLAQRDVNFGKPVKLRDTLEINGEEFKVIGTVDKIGNPPDDSIVYMPIDTARELGGLGEDEFDLMFVKIESGFDIDQIADEIEERMRKDRNLDEGEENFQVQTFESVLDTFGNIFNIVQAVIIGIASISLLVGGIGIMNTMYMSVIERTKEIGVMKAIGAKNSDIAKIFLIESGFYGLVGGAIGVAIGAGMAKLTEFVAGGILGTGLLRAEISPTLVIATLIFSFGVGLISGIAPAYRASRLRPVDALRYE